MKQAALVDGLGALEETHRHLDQEVYRLERRAHLTPTEQRRMSELKKLKLQAKDAIYGLKRSSRPPPAHE